MKSHCAKFSLEDGLTLLRVAFMPLHHWVGWYSPGSWQMQGYGLCKHLYKLARGLDQSLGCVQLFPTPWTVAHKAPLPMKFPRQKY